MRALLLAVGLLCGTDGASVDPEVIVEMNSVNYTTLCGRAASDFNVSHAIITGVKSWKGELYVTVPRWRDGIPATLAKLVRPAGEAPSQPGSAGAPSSGWQLQPFPDCAWQEVGNPFALQYVQSMEIDRHGRMWIIDAGRRNFWTCTPPCDAGVLNNSLPPRLIVLDLASGTTLRAYTFAPSVANRTTSFLNDIVVDESRMVAYISDAGQGAIIVYDFASNTARAFSDDTTTPNATFTASMPVAIAGGLWTLSPTGADGIALSSDRATLYYCPLSSRRLYMLPTAKLRDFKLSTAALSAAVTDLGERPSNSDGLAFSDAGKLYLGGLTTSALYEWTPGTPLSSMAMLAESPTLLNWIDTFAWDGRGNLLLTSNKLQRFSNGSYDMRANAPPNFRVLRVALGANSYLAAQPPFQPAGCPAALPACPTAVGTDAAVAAASRRLLAAQPCVRATGGPGGTPCTAATLAGGGGDDDDKDGGFDADTVAGVAAGCVLAGALIATVASKRQQWGGLRSTSHLELADAPSSSGKHSMSNPAFEDVGADGEDH